MKLLWIFLTATSLLGTTIGKDDMTSTEEADENDALLSRNSRSLENSGEEHLRRSLEATIGIVKTMQLRMEERVRSEGGSGIINGRRKSGGSEPYDNPHHSGNNGVAGLHAHSNNIRTVGAGEFSAVLNGIEFRTRHNDYRLNMPHRTEKTFHAFEPVPFPDVPPEVTSKTEVNEQISEMREWFKAFATQNHTVRDYRKYFKPVLCYLEGAWTRSSKTVEEPFVSDRHFIDAETWNELADKIEFTSGVGRKDRLENFAYLPTRVFGITNDSVPILAQWNYRIMCMPLKDDLPLRKIVPVEDIRYRMSTQRSFDEYIASRSAHFKIAEGNGRFTLLDELMYQIPGKDNQQGYILDEALGEEAQHMLTSEPLNAAYYHRWLKTSQTGAMGLSVRARGFLDSHFFFALNTQDKIQGFELEQCKGSKRRRTCTTTEQKGSYAIPHEIIMMTPLSNWNPYDLEYHGEHRSDEGKVVTADGRSGKKTPEKAYNGTNSKLYYRTPCEFFSGGEVSSDPADTAAKGSVGVLDKHGNVRAVCATGIRVTFPEIEGVGSLRQRYPVFPVHGKDSPVWKELAALMDIVLYPVTYGHMLMEQPPVPSAGGAATDEVSTSPTATVPKVLVLQTGESISDKVTRHRHFVDVTPEEIEALKGGALLNKTTTEAESHTHDITIDHYYTSAGREKFSIVLCDGETFNSRYRCWDRHNRFMGFVQ